MTGGGAWRHGRLKAGGGPELLFGRMHEDPGVELALFPPRSRVVCIASAGCTAFALAAAGHQVTAVDVNPAQIEYVRERLAGAPPRAGRVDRLLAGGRRAARLLGWRHERVRRFLAMDDPAAQAREWRERIVTSRLRLALDLALHPVVLRRAYDRHFVDALPPAFGRSVLWRLERGFAIHPNRINPFAWRLLLGDEPPDVAPGVDPSFIEPPGTAAPSEPEPIRLVVADVAEHLQTLPPASVDAFTLSNVLDGAPPAERARLLAAVARAAAPGAVALHRTFAPPASPAAEELAARDRSLLWGAIERLVGAERDAQAPPAAPPPTTSSAPQRLQ